MIVNAFDVKFHTKNEGMPPRAFIPKKKHKKKLQKVKNQTRLVFEQEPDRILRTGFCHGPERTGPDQNIPV